MLLSVHVVFWSCVLEMRWAQVRSQRMGEYYLYSLSNFVPIDCNSIDNMIMRISPFLEKHWWCISAGSSQRNKNANITFLCVWRRWCSLHDGLGFNSIFVFLSVLMVYNNSSMNMCLMRRGCLCVCALTGLQWGIRVSTGHAQPPSSSGVRVRPQSGSAGSDARQWDMWQCMATTNRPAAGPRTRTHTGSHAGEKAGIPSAVHLWL